MAFHGSFLSSAYVAAHAAVVVDDVVAVVVASGFDDLIDCNSALTHVTYP